MQIMYIYLKGDKCYWKRKMRAGLEDQVYMVASFKMLFEQKIEETEFDALNSSS